MECRIIESGEYNAGWFGAGTAELRVDADGFGIIDEAAEMVFTMGQCHSLALALHQLTGWDIVLQGTRDPVADPMSWIHAAVRHPAGPLLDIRGLDPEPFPETGAERTAPPEFLADGPLPTFPVNIDAALPFARTLVRDWA